MPGAGNSVEIEAPAPHAVVVVRGEIDIATSPDLDTAVADVLAEPTESLTVDLAAVTFMGSSGLASLLRAQRLVREQGGRFCVGAPSRAVSDLFQMTHLTERFEIADP